jgi:hypothetical protein
MGMTIAQTPRQHRDRCRPSYVVAGLGRAAGDADHQLDGAADVQLFARIRVTEGNP